MPGCLRNVRREDREGEEVMFGETHARHVDALYGRIERCFQEWTSGKLLIGLR